MKTGSSRSVKYGGAVTGIEENKAIIASIQKSRETGNWQLAEEGALFEKELSKHLNIKHAILTTSGSCAGLLALCALELPKRSEVIIPATTFPTIFNIILQCGLTPLVVDSKIGTYNLDVSSLENAIGPKTKAIIAVHALGNPVDLFNLRKICDKHDLKLIIDNCDGFGTELHDKKVEEYGDISFTSFHAAHIVSMGVGGGIFTDNDELAKNVRMYRDWGRQANLNEPHKVPTLPADYNPRFVYEKIGYNFQPLELQAAMGRVQLRKANEIKRKRKENFDALYGGLKKYKDLIMPETIKGADVCWFAFPLTYKGNRGELTKFLEENGIETRSMFAGNILKHPAYKNVIYDCVDELKEADYILEQSFWIGLHPRYDWEDMQYVISIFDKFFDARTS